MNDCLISVIVPIYNVEKYIEKCLCSIIASTYKNLEIVLVDDGSEDNSINVINNIKDDRIKFFRKENGGLSDARNFALDKITGKYVIFVDSDDYIDTNMILKLYTTLVNNEADIAICDYIYVDEFGNHISNLENQVYLSDECIDSREFFNKYLSINFGKYIPVWNKLYKSSLFEKERFDKGKLHEDEFIFHRIIMQCHKIACITDRLYYYVQRQNSIMNKGKNLRNLDAIEALYYRFIFFESEGYRDLLPKIEENMLWILRIIIYNLNDCDFKTKQFQENIGLYKKVVLYLLFHSDVNLKRKIRYVYFLLFRKNFLNNLYKIVEE